MKEERLATAGSFQNNVGQCALTLGHGLRRTHLADLPETPRISRYPAPGKSFGYINVQKNVPTGLRGNQQGSRAEAEHKSQGATVKAMMELKACSDFR